MPHLAPKSPGHSTLDTLRPRRAFTLIELLTVVAIIGIIMSLVVGAGRYGRMKATMSRTKAELEHIATALNNYSMNNGVYPLNMTSVDVTTTRSVSNSLPENVDCTDPWGRQYVYSQGAQGLSYTLHSKGPLAGASDTADDIHQGR